jgi:hypothetical protein
MNVTIKISDDLVRMAKHRAVDENLSLSAWIAQLLTRELGLGESKKSDGLLELLGDESLVDVHLELPKRDEAQVRPIEFP